VAHGIASKVGRYRVRIGSAHYIFDDEKLKGAVKGNVVGTYIHGIFDNSEFTNHFLNEVRKLKGLDKVDEDFSFKEYKNREYDKLAQILRENVDIDKVYEIMGIK